MLRVLLALVCVLFSMPAGVAQDIAPVERGWIIVHEDLELFLEPASGKLVLEGSMLVRLEYDESSIGPMLAINSRSEQMVFDDVSAPGAEVELNTSHPDMGVSLISVLTFAQPKQRGDEVLIHFSCHKLKNGRQFVVHESIALASWVEAWYPIMPQQLGASLGGATKIAGTTTFHMPLGWHAVSNGGLISSEQNDTETVEVWSTERALSRSFSAGPYTVTRERVGELDVSLYLLSDDLPEPEKNVISLAVAMKAMEARYGPYPYPSYAIAEVPQSKGHFGASSEQGFIMVKPLFLQVRGGNLALFAHEAGHGWWGNTVGTKAPGELVCSETLAQYGAVIAVESVYGREGATDFLRFSRPGYVAEQCARGYFELTRAGADKPLQDLVSGQGMDHTISDAKGHWVIHMLRARVGDEVFFATMRGLITEFTDSQMSLDDLRARFVSAAPDAGLETFFRQWFEWKGAPVLVHDWELTEDGLALTVLQMQEGEAYDLLIDVGIEGDDGVWRTQTIHLTDPEQGFLLEGVEDAQDVRLDPEHKLLLWEPEYGPAPVEGLEHVQLRPLEAAVTEPCVGQYKGAGVDVRVEQEQGQLVLYLRGRAEPLVHAGKRTFRSEDGFVVFQGEGEQADGLLYVHDSGSVREAERVD